MGQVSERATRVEVLPVFVLGPISVKQTRPIRTHRLTGDSDTIYFFGKRSASDLHLHHVVLLIDVPLHLVSKAR